MKSDSTTVPNLQPDTPYPGLRPFRDSEFMLLLGRDRQIRDVIERLGHPVASKAGQSLGAMRFVTVLGGSGSGKSSLLRAGVVPQLRTNGLPEVGDLWESVVCTPGSDFVRNRAEAPRETPIVRLAREFDGVLRPPSDAAQGESDGRERRRAHIAELLRQPGGIDTVVTVYGAELMRERAGATGACVLVVIDQFEELFHRSNWGQRDVELLIQRVIEHFHQARRGEGSPRCFLALTMRSEHLQDCAGYIGLPEAINASAYLVGRLDRADLRQVIELPAKRYLRICQRRRPVNPSLTADVTFDLAVTERLVTDAVAIRHDPDHLPLLQHALARLWQIAREREGITPGGVPASINVGDLRRCVHPRAPPVLQDGVTFNFSGNLLVACLQRWADYRYGEQSSSDRARLDKVLRQLAYKDPFNGTYTQQRYNLEGNDKDLKPLKDLLQGRWIDDVNYLYWDDRNERAKSLKVSHEALVRKWQHFKELVDADAMRFERFKDLLEWCVDWTAAKGRARRFGFLLDRSMFKRMAEARLDEALGPLPTWGVTLRRNPLDEPAYAGPWPPLWKKWKDWLDPVPVNGSAAVAMGRIRTVDMAGLRAYYKLSRWKASGTFALPWIVVLFGLIGGFLFLYSRYVQGPFIESASSFTRIADSNLTAKGAGAFTKIGHDKLVLKKVLTDARELQNTKLVLWDGKMSEVLRVAARTVEPGLNEKLRTLLTSGLWWGPNVKTKPMNNVGNQATCRDWVKIGAAPRDTSGISIFADENSQRPQLLLVNRHDGLEACSSAKPLASLPEGKQKPLVFADVLLDHLFVVHKPSGSLQRHLTLYSVIQDESEVVVGVQQTSKVTIGGPADRLSNHAGSRILNVSAVLGGHTIEVGNENWRIVTADQATAIPGWMSTGKAVEFADEDDACKKLGKVLSKLGNQAWINQTASLSAEQEYPDKTRGEKQYCLVLTSVPKRSGQSDTTVLQVYQRPQDNDWNADGSTLKRELPNLMNVQMENVRFKDVDWFAGTGCTNGWLIFRRKAVQDAPDKGVPWSTQALVKLAEQVLDPKHHCNAESRPVAER